MSRAAVFVAAAAAALAVSGNAFAARFAVGVDPAASLPKVGDELRAFGAR